MPTAAFEPAILTAERPQNNALECLFVQTVGASRNQ
jgi:hypothetical protein